LIDVKPHQRAAGDRVYDLVSFRRFAYLAGEPRSGKTRTALYVAERMGVHCLLVLTKKNAIPGWHSEIADSGYVGDVCVTNYEQAGKLRAGDFDLVILDEAHNLGNRGRPTQRFRTIRAIAWHEPLICLSGTPVVETPLAIYHQTAISKHGPFSKFRNFYQFWRAWGIPSERWVGPRQVEQYDKAKSGLLEEIGHVTVTMTQADAGITQGARDRVHVVELDAWTLENLNYIARESFFPGVDAGWPLESDMAVRAALHQIETGAIAEPCGHIQILPNREVLDYCLGRFSPDRTAIMCHYRATREKFGPLYPHVFSSNAHAEGVDLSGFEYHVVVNTDYSGAKFVQRRERSVRMDQEGGRTVHHIVTDGGISQAVYESVSGKRDFNLRAFREWRSEATRSPVRT